MPEITEESLDSPFSVHLLHELRGLRVKTYLAPTPAYARVTGFQAGYSRNAFPRPLHSSGNTPGPA